MIRENKAPQQIKIDKPLVELNLPINEIFYSLQGEGSQTGTAMIFIRIAGCNLRCPYCDTNFLGGKIMTLAEIYTEIKQYPSREILWTGGEPTLLLNDLIVEYFHKKGYRQSIETNGTLPPPRGIDYISCSPKPEAFGRLAMNFPKGVDEWRFPFGEGIPLPPSQDSLPPAKHYFLSPIFDPEKEGIAQPERQKALDSCLKYVLEHPQWKMSVQTHKLVGFQ